MTRQILHVDLDAFFVSVEQARNPDLRGRPVIVGGRPGGRRGVVACASYEARKFGVHAAMPLPTAHRLCPEAVFLPGDFRAYQEYSSKFMDILADFTPDLEPGGLDEAYMDLTGFEPLYGPVRTTALRIKSRIKSELGITASIGIASCKIVAKVASDLSKPDGLLEVPPGAEGEFLAPLPVGKLPGVGRQTEKELKRIGVVTIGQLAALPPTFLRQKFGSYGERLGRYAAGMDERPVQAYGPVKSIGREITLDQDTLDEEYLRAMLRRLAGKVGTELRSQGKQARTITLKVRYADFETVSRSLTLPSAGDSDREIYDAGAALLEKTLNHRRYPVRLIGIRVSNLGIMARQLSLWDDRGQRMAYLDRAIDAIRKKYGFDAIGTGRIRPRG